MEWYDYASQILKTLTSSLEYVKDAIWFYLEPIAYHVINFLLNKIVMPVLEYVANNFLLSLALLFIVPIGYFIFKDFIVTAYKMVIS